MPFLVKIHLAKKDGEVMHFIITTFAGILPFPEISTVDIIRCAINRLLQKGLFS
jgi:hypothetical protein